jgi:alkylation response protein AidB-like acyl-CoA dehydrogenase
MWVLTDEQKLIKAMVRKLAQEKIMPRAAEIDENDEYPEDIVRILAEHDILKLSLPEEYGGINADSTTLSLVISELSEAMAPIGSLLLSTQSVIQIINAFGNKRQKDRIFTELSVGDKLLAVCITEPNAGSDAHSLQTRAVPKADHYVVNGTKRWITLAGVSEYYLVIVRTAERSKKNDLSVLLVRKDTPGLSIGKKDNKMGMRGSVTADLIFEDAVVPKDNLIGNEGDGLQIMAKLHSSLRCSGAASMALGIAQSALDYATRYSKERYQFGKPISEFQAIQFMLADMEMMVEAARSLIYRTNFQVDKEGDQVSDRTMSLVSMAKCFACDVAMRVTTDGVQILGGYGVSKEYPIQRMMRDAKCLQIMDGTNQIHRMIVGKNLLKRY